MVIRTFTSFDPSPYLRAPQLPLQTLAVLADALSSRFPKDAPGHVRDAEQAMRATVHEAKQAMVVRLRENNVARVAADFALDNGVDGVWGLTRDRLSGWDRYLRSGLDCLLDVPGLHFAATRERSQQAAKLLVELFGDGNLDMLGKAYPEQSQLMDNILALIESDGHASALGDLAGQELLPILQSCQGFYAAMVDRRSGADDSSKVDLRPLRSKLQRRIVTYASLVVALVDEDDQASIDQVEATLLPMLQLRNPRSTSGDADDADEAEGDEGLALLEQLANEAQTLDEIGD